MSLTAEEIQQLLPKPPRLLSSESGYDWREFDRWLQRLYLLLGPQVGTSLNIPSQMANDADTTSAELGFIPNYDERIQRLQKQIDDLKVEIGAL